MCSMQCWDGLHSHGSQYGHSVRVWSICPRRGVLGVPELPGGDVLQSNWIEYSCSMRAGDVFVVGRHVVWIVPDGFYLQRHEPSRMSTRHIQSTGG